MLINGNLKFHTLGLGEIQNAILERMTTTERNAASHAAGRIVYDTDLNTFYYSTGSIWVTFATGGDATAVQNEVNALEGAIGTSINGDGTFNAAAFTAFTHITTPTSLTNALSQLDTAISGKDALAEMVDVAFGTLVNDDILQYNGTTSKWENVVVGSASGIQPYDAGLSALASFNTNGILVQTADNTFAGRTLVAPSSGVTITNPAGIAGDITFALANDLAAVEGISSLGFAVRTASETWTTRDIATASAGRIVVTNGDGIAASPTIDLATVTPSAGGTFQKFTTDSYGRVSAVTNVIASDITGLVDGTYVNVTGDTMSGNLTMTGGSEVLGLPTTPSGATAAVSKAYVDALVSAGATWRNPIMDVNLVDVVSAIPGSPQNGCTYIKYSGTQNETWGAVTNVVDNDILTWTGTVWTRIDTLNAGDRFVIAGEDGTIGATLSGVGFVNDDLIQYVSGDPGLFASWSLPEGRGNGGTGTEISQGITVLVGNPSSYHYGHTYLYNNTGNTWYEIAGPSSISAGVGLSYSGNVLNVNVGAGIVELPTDEVGIDLYSTSAGAIVLTTDGTSRSTASGAKLHLLLPAGSGLTQDATGLYIGADAITNAMILNDSITLDADDTGSTTVALGGTLAIFGTSSQGISTSISGSNLVITAADATTTTKGVASFNASHFSVVSGAVSLNATLSDLTDVDTSTDAPTTNDVLAWTGSTWAAVTPSTVIGGGTLDNLNDVVITSAADNQTIVWNGTNWVNQKVYHLETVASASSTWVVTHNIGQQFCNVTVVDSTNNVIIPQSIVFDSTTQLTVTFNSSITGKVVVMGIA